MKELNISEMNMQQGRKPYRKPEVQRVALRPEEAVLGACKAIGGTVGGGTGDTCSVVSCQTQGS
jgi:hypothetical protein